jgi:hypothetical protein
MPSVAIHCIRIALRVAPIILLTGCWKEVEYKGSTSSPPSKPVATAPANDTAQAKQAILPPADNHVTTNAPPETSAVAPTTSPPSATEPTTPAAAVRSKTSAETDRYAIPPKSDEPIVPAPSSTAASNPPAQATSSKIEQPARPAPAVTSVTPPAKSDTGLYAPENKRPDSNVPAKSPITETPSVPATQWQQPTRHTDGTDASVTASSEKRPAQPNTRRAAWRLGSRLSQAALANDRGMSSESVTKWFDEARSAARLLGTSIPDLPESTAAIDSGQVSQRVLDYLGIQYDRIARDLTKNNQPESAALFEIALKSNILILLYSPTNTSAAAVASAVKQAASLAKLPDKLWQPLVVLLNEKAPVDDVRAAVRKMHKDVDEFLANSAEPNSR